MTHLLGVCAAGHPDCFADPYGVDAIYTRISMLDLHLKRGRVLTASCPDRGRQPNAEFVLAKVDLRYTSDAEMEQPVEGACR